ncbi:MAG: glutathione S-transferase family protein [Pseudomonadota bacterium]|nr:glutathione S-transferase family protein [Pseudomonadota bacterium]
MELTLYYQPGSRAQRVRWVLEELGLDYRLEHIDLGKGEGRSPEYRAIHPLGQLPALKVNNEVMIESGAIVQWLAEAYPDGDLAPTHDSPYRRDFLQWMYFSVTSLEWPAWEIVLHQKILPDKLAVKEIIPFAMKRLESVLKILEQSLDGQDYILDSGFSAADIMLGYIVMWFKEELDSYPALLSYVERLQQRPAYIKSKT